MSGFFALVLASLPFAHAGVNRRETLGIMATLAARPSSAIQSATAPLVNAPLMDASVRGEYAFARIYHVLSALGDFGEGFRAGPRMRPKHPDGPWGEIEDVSVIHRAVSLMNEMAAESPEADRLIAIYLQVGTDFFPRREAFPAEAISDAIARRLGEVNGWIGTDFQRVIRAERAGHSNTPVETEAEWRERVWQSILRWHGIASEDEAARARLIERLTRFERDLSTRTGAPITLLHDHLAHVIYVRSGPKGGYLRRRFVRDKILVERLREGLREIEPALIPKPAPVKITTERGSTEVRWASYTPGPSRAWSRDDPSGRWTRRPDVSFHELLSRVPAFADLPRVGSPAVLETNDAPAGEVEAEDAAPCPRLLSPPVPSSGLTPDSPSLEKVPVEVERE